MPSISMFYGIIVYMYFLDNKQHHTPHIHAKYQNEEVIVSIPNGEVLDGTLPNPKLKLLLAWIEIHQDELMADWDLALSGQLPYKIDPLK
jgi:desulfoferrodoxin (superoxide reductase-like protein)